MNYVEPNMHTIRPGLELCYKTDPTYSEGYTPLVFSHRRAGTHMLGEFIQMHWNRDWLKSHDFPERLPINKYPTFYVVRNPFDVIHATFNWWNAQGGAHNEEVSGVIAGLNFHDYLEGKWGEAIGYQGWVMGDKDSFYITRGMEYDPIRYWRDHYRAAFEAGAKIITYEELALKPRNAAEKVAQVLGDLDSYEHIKTIPPVGMSPNIKPVGSAFRYWPKWAIDKVTNLTNDKLLKAAGFESVEAWCFGSFK